MKCKKIKSSEINYLPEEILREVLCRLPVKSLLKCRSLSKALCKTIDDPEFISMHMTTYKKNQERSHVLTVEIIVQANNRNKSIIAVRHCDTFRSGWSLDTREKGEGYFYKDKFPASIDGLVLMVTTERIIVKRGFQPFILGPRFLEALRPKKKKGMECTGFPVTYESLSELKVWNPYIKKLLSLPTPPCPCRKRDWLYNKYTLGFAPSTNDYKVGLFNLQHNNPLCLLFSIREGHWTTLALDVIAKDKWCMSHELVCSKRSTYWLTAQTTKSYVADRTSYTHIASFDYDIDGFSFMKLPQIVDEMLLFLCEVNESVALFGISAVSTRIWVLGNDGREEAWISWYVGGSSATFFNYFNSFRYLVSPNRVRVEKMFYMEKAGNSILLVDTERHVKTFDLNSHKLIHDTGIFTSSYPRIIAVYKESLLLSLNGGLEGDMTALPQN